VPTFAPELWLATLKFYWRPNVLNSNRISDSFSFVAQQSKLIKSFWSYKIVFVGHVGCDRFDWADEQNKRPNDEEDQQSHPAQPIQCCQLRKPITFSVNFDTTHPNLRI
jgi:hypothetical protein